MIRIKPIFTHLIQETWRQKGQAQGRTGTRPVPTLFEIMGAFKSITTNGYINCVKQNNWPPFRKRLWQLRYHDRIIRVGQRIKLIRQLPDQKNEKDS